MTSRLYTSQLIVPVGTPIAAPFSQPVVLDDINLDKVTVIIPDGHAGLTGVAIFWGGVQIVPYTGATWLTGNGEAIDFEYDGQVTAAGLTVAGYNLDVFQHAFLFRWFLSPLTGGSPVTIDSANTAAGAALSTAGIGDLSGTVLVGQDAG